MRKMISTGTPVLDRVIVIIDGKPRPISIVQIYAPTITDHKNDVTEAFYNVIERVMKKMRLDGST